VVYFALLFPLLFMLLFALFVSSAFLLDFNKPDKLI
jgi:hypothetical protein